METRSGLSSQDRIALRHDLAAAGLVDASAGWHRLRGGRTNRSWRSGAGQGAVVVKLYDVEAQSPLFPNDPVAEESVLRLLADAGLAPRLIGSVPTPFGPVIVYAHVPGTRWFRGPASVGRLLARLHAAPIPDGLRVRASGSAALVAETALILNGCSGPVADQLRAVLDWWVSGSTAGHGNPEPGIEQAGNAALLRGSPPMPDLLPAHVNAPDTVRVSLQEPAVARPVLIHTDPVPGNIIMASGGPLLIDWQCPASGDPCDDLAAFLSPAMQHLYRGMVLTQTEVAEFLQAYGDAAVTDRYRRLAAAYHLRMAAHCLWKAERGSRDHAAGVALERDAGGF